MSATPAISVVIPSFARPERLANCLESLAAIPSADFEVVVVDDGSPQPLAPIGDAFTGRLALRFLRQDNAGPAAARNAGARAATGALLAFTDDDCVIDTGWLTALHTAHLANPGALLGGRVVNALPDNVYAEASQDLVDYLYEYFGAKAGDAPFFTSNNIACGRARFLELGGFDESFPLAAAEDREIGLRWRDAGGALVYVPDAIVGHAHNLDLSRFWRQHSNYGRGARHLHKVRVEHGQPRPPLERLGFYSGLITYPLRKYGAGGLPRSALMLVSQVAMTAGFVRNG